MPARPPPRPEATPAPQKDEPKPAKKAAPLRPKGSVGALNSQEEASAAARQAQGDPPPALAKAAPPQEEIGVEPHDNADFSCPSPAASPPREPPPAAEESRSAPAVDAASPPRSPPPAVEESSHARAAISQEDKGSASRSGGDSPQEEAVPKRSGEKPAAHEDPCDEFVCMLVFHGMIDHLFFCLRGGLGYLWIVGGRGAGGK